MFVQTERDERIWSVSEYLSSTGRDLDNSNIFMAAPSQPGTRATSCNFEC